MTITTYHDDCLSVLPTLAPGSVQALISSPPFFGLRAYSIPPSAWPEVSYAPMPGLAPLTIAPMVCQLGAEPTPEAYTAHLVHVMRLARAAIREDGVAWLNFGDSYGSGGSGQNFYDPAGQRAGGGRTTTEGGMGHSKWGGVPGMEKQLLGIPWRVAFALQADGWVLRSDAIWSKPNTMPESVRDRPTRAHEYVFLFGKSKTYYYDAAAVSETQHGDGRRRGGIGGKQAGMNGNRTYSGRTWQDSETNGTRNLRSVWTIPTTPSSFADDCPACYGTGIDRLAQRGAHDRMRDTDAWRAWAAEQPKCAECAGSGRVGEDHFAVWPPALVEIMVKASTAAQACAVCGAAWGRVVEREPMVIRRTTRGERMGEYGRTQTSGTMIAPAKTTDCGFAPRCACADDGAGRSAELQPDDFDLIETPTGERVGDDPSLVTGRAGMNRPRGDNEGRRPITRYEQRMYAAQLRRSSYRAEMEQESGATTFAHYTRTDRAGARPVPPHLLEMWIDRGWLTAVEVPSAALPTTTGRSVVLDPFAGSGTTLAVAERLGRDSIGIDLGYEQARAKRLGAVQTSMEALL